jgi:hypothetical protein
MGKLGKFYKKRWNFQKAKQFNTGFEELSKNLPLHHIDSDVIMEEPDSELGRQCGRYLDKCGIKFKAKISIPTLGEMCLKALSLESDKMNAFFEYLQSRLTASKVGIFNLDNPEAIIDKLKSVSDFDSRIKNTDKLILACALADGDSPKHLVTFDGNMLGFQMEGCNLEVTHPKDLF